MPGRQPETGGNWARQVRAVRRARAVAVASLIPGLGHLLAGRIRTGVAVLGAAIAVVGGLGVVAVSLGPPEVERLFVRSDFLLALMIGLLVLGLAWCSSILSAYRIARPTHMTAAQERMSQAVLAALCLAVMAPMVYGAQNVHAHREVLTEVFRSDRVDPDTGDAADADATESPSPEPEETPAGKPFADQERLNVLLLGGDGGHNRRGVRTDTIVLSSTDPETGRTALISLPRNLENVPLRPGTPLAKAFPNGFPGFWFGLYTAAEDNPSLMPEVRPENAGAAAVADTVSHLTGVEVDYYALVNMEGFRKLVNSVGGVDMDVRSGDGQPIPIGGSHNADGSVKTRPHKTIELGEQHLNGYNALWYARSRFGSTDAERQARQRCLLSTMARQVDPGDALDSVRKFTDAMDQVVLTNIPAEKLPEFADLAREHAKDAEIDRVTVLDVIGSSADPDVDALRDRVQSAVDGDADDAAHEDYGVQRAICPEE